MRTYVGSELEMFATATHWKSYYGRIIRRYLRGHVLEVGSGIGATTEALCDGSASRWVCLEPDGEMSAAIQRKISAGLLPGCCEALTGTVLDLPSTEKFDAIIYIDVLEHIEDDAQEVLAAASHLRESGVLTVLSPAHQWLFTAFDGKIGHYRRYNRESLAATVPANLRLIELRYLDSVGVLASLANRLLLKSSAPTEGQIRFWDKVMIPLARMIDPVLGYRFGKSILGIWRKE